MKKKILTLIVSLTISFSAYSGDNGFFWGAGAASGNLWSGYAIGFVENLVNLAFDYPVFSAPESKMNFYSFYTYNAFGGSKDVFTDWFNRYFGFRAKNLFGDLEGNLKVGWMGPTSPIGFYAYLGYRYNRFDFALASDLEKKQYQVGYLVPGLGVRVSPCNFFENDWDVLPLVEVATKYHKPSRVKTPFGTDLKQLNGGLSYCVSIGFDAEPTYSSFDSVERMSFLIGYEWNTFDMFNTGYSLNAGKTLPYNGFTSKVRSLVFQFNTSF